tara:strand:- start:502 stop:930 length:429 start_codon:yes stop_codon:yes gene_type:complete
MIRISLFASACFALAACGAGNSAKDATSACNGMLAGDPEIEEDLAEDGETVAAYCGCFGQLLADQPEADQTAILKVSQVIGDIREERNVGLEDAAEGVDKSFGADGSSEAYGVSSSEFETTGKYFDVVRRELNKDDSACTAP